MLNRKIFINNMTSMFLVKKMKYIVLDKLREYIDMINTPVERGMLVKPLVNSQSIHRSWICIALVILFILFYLFLFSILSNLRSVVFFFVITTDHFNLYE